MMEIIKNKEEVKSVMNIIQAFANGKTIQAIDPYEDEWVDQAALNFKALFDGQYRIKSEPKYRPFANAEECWKEMQKHQPFAWVKEKHSDRYSLITEVNGLSIKVKEGCLFTDSVKYYTFVDGTPFGVKVEE